MPFYSSLILFLGCLTATAAILTVRQSKWIALYMAFTSILCVGSVAIANEPGSPINFPINARAQTLADRAEPTPAPATLAAIHALYVASDVTQRAVDNDVCRSGEAAFLDSSYYGDRLTGENKRQYGHIRDALSAAYSAAEGGDESLTIVQRDFCFGASER